MLTTGEKWIEHGIERLHAIPDSGFSRAVCVLLGPAIVGGNRVEVLLNGDEIFPAMLATTRGTTTSIILESFIHRSGTTGEAFADALVVRARVGVKVHLLVD